MYRYENIFTNINFIKNFNYEIVFLHMLELAEDWEIKVFILLMGVYAIY